MFRWIAHVVRSGETTNKHVILVLAVLGKKYLKYC
jgi:hypothetical protein